VGLRTQRREGLVLGERHNPNVPPVHHLVSRLTLHGLPALGRIPADLVEHLVIELIHAARRGSTGVDRIPEHRRHRGTGRLKGLAIGPCDARLPRAPLIDSATDGEADIVWTRFKTAPKRRRIRALGRGGNCRDHDRERAKHRSVDA